MREIKKKIKHAKPMSATRKIAFSFIFVILVGSVLLSLPIANKGAPTSYLNNLFIATSATCVTGLVPVVPVQQYSIFGQVVILLLIQIGGLGFITFISMIFVYAKKMTLNSKLTLQEALSVTSLHNIPRFLKNVIGYTFLIELIGAILLSIQFTRDYGIIKGMYYGVFHSISAFCNAGFDILGDTSLMSYQTNTLVNLTIASLIILGGLGFYVWFDVANKIKAGIQNRFTLRKIWKTLELHSKLVIVVSTVLLGLGTLLVLIFEYHNQLEHLSFSKKILCSFFQSVTLRTAGFASINYGALNLCTKVFMCIFMFIGGSPAGTAGGIKTTTLGLIVATAKSSFRGESSIHCFERRIDTDLLKHIVTMLFISILVVFSGILVLSITDPDNFIDLMFEVFSAFGTVGLSANYTMTLSCIGKIAIIILMYIGRIGPMTMMLSFTGRLDINQSKRVYPKGEILIG